jgi:hypothetical protein
MSYEVPLCDERAITIFFIAGKLSFPVIINRTCFKKQEFNRWLEETTGFTKYAPLF